jgi:hypothetical protein
MNAPVHSGIIEIMGTLATHSLLEEALRSHVEFVGLTVDQYDWLVENGKLPEDATTELIDGFMVKKDRSAAWGDPTTVGDRHRFAVMMLARLDPEFGKFGCCSQSQQPISLPPRNESEPDLAVLHGTVEDYRLKKPWPIDVYSVIEVSESSLGRDLGTKLRVYAAAKIPQYIVVNLIDNLILVHEHPIGSGYGNIATLRAGDTLHISAGQGNFVGIEVARVF